LDKIEYEGTNVYKCVNCKGVLVKDRDIKKVLVRESKEFDPDIIRQAELAKKEWGEAYERIKRIEVPFAINCPHCRGKMRRRLFSSAAPVEVDACEWCGSVWFDQNELEVVQVIYDQHHDKENLIKLYFLY
jgi:Zn-finger nucleic acid-binding protein